jgi:hypothetical protein
VKRLVAWEIPASEVLSDLTIVLVLGLAVADRMADPPAGRVEPIACVGKWLDLMPRLPNPLLPPSASFVVQAAELSVGTFRAVRHGLADVREVQPPDFAALRRSAGLGTREISRSRLGLSHGSRISA